jgi:predicted nucleic acid-binding protein
MGPLVDTSVIVDAYHGAVTPAVATLRRHLIDGPPPAITPVILQEVLQGANDERALGLLARDLSFFEPLGVPSYVLHERAAEIFRRARRAGLPSSTVDVLIVAVAAANRRPLLSSDSVQRRVAAIAGVELA